jgi:hypothetical protein
MYKLQINIRNLKDHYMKITGSFLDEISYDIPHQNWGRVEWDKDFAAMKAIGINKVILIRCGLRRWMTYPSQVLQKDQGCFTPSVDLVQMFLELAEKYDLALYFGTYDSGHYWQMGEYQKEVELNKRVVEEAWIKYGKFPAFRGWYLTQEVSRNTRMILLIFTLHWDGFAKKWLICLFSFLHLLKVRRQYRSIPTISREMAALLLNSMQKNGMILWQA